MKISDHLTPSLREAPVNDSLITPDGKTLRELARPGVISEEQIRRYIKLVPWRTAKDGSHEYTLFEWVPDSWPYFAAFVQHIRNHGYPAYFYGRVFDAYDIDGMRYWTMGYPIVAERPEDQTILINRALNLPGDPHRQPNYPVREK